MRTVPRAQAAPGDAIWTQRHTGDPLQAVSRPPSGSSGCSPQRYYSGGRSAFARAASVGILGKVIAGFFRAQMKEVQSELSETDRYRRAEDPRKGEGVFPSDIQALNSERFYVRWPTFPQPAIAQCFQQLSRWSVTFLESAI